MNWIAGSVILTCTTGEGSGVGVTLIIGILGQ